MEAIYLSRRNLLTLLSKLDRVKNGDYSECTLIKFKKSELPDNLQQTMDSCLVTAIDDEEYYSYEEAGEVHQADDPSNKVS